MEKLIVILRDIQDDRKKWTSDVSFILNEVKEKGHIIVVVKRLLKY